MNLATEYLGMTLPTHIKTVLSDLDRWLEQRGHRSLTELRGTTSLFRVLIPKPTSDNYMLTLQSFRRV